VAITNLVEEARSLAKSLNPKDRTEIEKLCDEIDKLKNELANEVHKFLKCCTIECICTFHVQLYVFMAAFLY